MKMGYGGFVMRHAMRILYTRRRGGSLKTGGINFLKKEGLIKDPIIIFVDFFKTPLPV